MNLHWRFYIPIIGVGYSLTLARKNKLIISIFNVFFLLFNIIFTYITFMVIVTNILLCCYVP